MLGVGLPPFVSGFPGLANNTPISPALTSPAASSRPVRPHFLRYFLTTNPSRRSEGPTVMRQPNNGYGSGGSEWLPSQNWQEIAKKRQEKIAVAEAERAYKDKLFRRRLLLTLFVLGTIGIVAPATLYPRFAQADQIDAEMGYTEAEDGLITFGGRLGNAEPIVSDGDEFLVDDTAQSTGDAQEGQQDFAVFGEEAPAPATDIASEQAYDATGDVAAVDPQAQQPAWEQSQPSQVAVESYAGEPAVVEEPQPAVVQSESLSYDPPAYEVVQETASASASEPSWWSVPSWSTASAPQSDNIGIWDTHYYIAHNWTSYGEVILNLKNGDTLSIDGQRLMVTDSAFFYAGTDYETVRARFGWDAWCMQTCYGDTQVRVVSLMPIS